jgi:hypothetical protein
MLEIAFLSGLSRLTCGIWAKHTLPNTLRKFSEDLYPYRTSNGVLSSKNLARNQF